MRVRRPPESASRGPVGRQVALEAWTTGAGDARVAVLVHTDVTTSDITIPGEVLATALQARVRLVAPRRGQLVGVEPSRPVIVSDPFDELSDPDVVVVPGGLGWRSLARDDECLEWLRSACSAASGVLSVSTGSLVLAAAGLLDGQDAAGHWLGLGSLARLGAHPVPDRTHVSHDGHLVTTSGALAAATGARTLADRIRYGPA